MNRYECLIMSIGSDKDIEVISTNGDVISWITEQVHRLVPKVIESNYPFGERIPSQERLGRRFRQMDFTQWAIAWWIVQQLCLDGWEPYGETHYLFASGVEYITMRRVIE